MMVVTGKTGLLARAVALAMLAGALLGCAPETQAQIASVQSTALQPVLLAPAGAGTMGVFDPSLATDGGPAVYMAFSAVDPAPGRRGGERIVTTYLARSTESGGHWIVVGGPVNPTITVTLGRAAGGGTATWHNEVAALLHDPYAPPSQRWRLVWHRYLILGERRLFEHGWIAYRAANTPEALAGTPEVKLFGGLGYAPVNDDPGGATRSPVAGPPRVPLHQRDPALARCVAFTEPAMAATESALLLALNCAEFQPGDGIVPKIVLLRCGRPCRIERPGAWDYAGTLLDGADAARFGAKGFSAADLHDTGGAHYLIATPTSDRPFPDAYNGCIAFRFSDLEGARLDRDASGRPMPVLAITGAPNSFNGACAADVAAYGGRLLIGEVELRGGQPRFGIFVSGSGLP